MNYLKILRPVNLLFIIAVICVMDKGAVKALMLQYQLSEPLLWWQLLLLIVAIVLIAAGGYVINDYFDVKIDAINRPERLIVTRGISKQQAMTLFQCLTAAGILCGGALAAVLKSMPLGLTFLLVPGILWFYSASYKRQFLIGNLTVAFLAALVPLTLAIAADAAIKNEFGQDSMLGQYLINAIYLRLAAFAAFAFLTTWAREIIKDTEDQEGDRELECHTMPVVLGDTVSKVCATLVILIVMTLLVLGNVFYIKGGFDITNNATKYDLLLQLCFIVTLVILWRARLPQDYHNAQLAMKLSMLLGTLLPLVVF